MPDDSTSPIPKDADEASLAFRKPHSYVDAGTERLAYWRFGRGPDVVLIHGWPLHSATFRRIVPAFAPQLTVHLFDLPGTGFRLSEQGNTVSIKEALDAADADEAAAKALRDCL